MLEQAGDAYHLADLFHIAGYRALWSGDDDDAAEYLARAVALTRELDDPYLWMLVRGKSGLAALLTDDTAGAAAAFREQLELARELVVLPVAFDGLRGLAAVAARHGDLDRAARLYGAAGAHRYAATGAPDRRARPRHVHRTRPGAPRHRAPGTPPRAQARRSTSVTPSPTPSTSHGHSLRPSPCRPASITETPR